MKFSGKISSGPVNKI